GDNVRATGSLAIRNNKLLFWCYGAKHTWLGTLTYHGYTFASEAADPLTFVVDAALGYRYAGGSGTVTFPDGSQYTLPLGTVQPTAGPDAVTYLGDLKPASYKLGYGLFSVGTFKFSSEDPADHIRAGDPIMLGGQPDPHAIFAHAPSQIVYQLDGKYQSLTAVIGMVSWINCGDGVSFTILVDGKEVYYRPVVKPTYDPVKLLAMLNGGQELTLVTGVGENGNMDCDWAIWGEPVLH
ncbi:MAG: NPCBM/NEW2 domain-containing protein, partial [Chloroflexota bacterium]